MKKLIRLGIVLALVLALTPTLFASASTVEILWWRSDNQGPMANENTARKLDRYAQRKHRQITSDYIAVDSAANKLVISDPEVTAMGVCCVRVDYNDTTAFRKVEGNNKEAIVRFDDAFIDSLEKGTHTVYVDFLDGQYLDIEIEIA